MNEIRSRIEEIRIKIDAAAKRSGRNASDITLLAVTKLHEPAEIAEAVNAGITDAAENRVGELLRKQPLVSTDLTWHLIGHLQTNKVRQIVGTASLIHSVDSLHLAEEIDKRAAAAGIVQNVLVQVNAANEPQKSGIRPEDAETLLHDIDGKCPNVNVKGLMFIAPAADDPEDVRIYFRQVKMLFDRFGSIPFERTRMEILSMGMSGDYEVAIEEGSTMVRIGTAVFGKRDYSKEQEK